VANDDDPHELPPAAVRRGPPRFLIEAPLEGQPRFFLGADCSEDEQRLRVALGGPWLDRLIAALTALRNELGQEAEAE
jgi:hypothetical protein